MTSLIQRINNREVATRPRFYSVPVTIGSGVGPVAVGEKKLASVQVQDVPFILKRITWEPTSPNGVGPAANPLSLIPLSYFNVVWRTDIHVYAAEPIPINAAFGSPLNIHTNDLPSPVEMNPKTTITFEVFTTIARLYPVSIQFVLHGVEPDMSQKTGI